MGDRGLERARRAAQQAVRAERLEREQAEHAKVIAEAAADARKRGR